jgi:beta-1,2-mannosidase
MGTYKKNLLFGCGALMSLSLALRITPSPAPNVRITAERLQHTPLISPDGDEEASAGTFNPAAVKHGNETVLLYREQDSNGTSRIAYASSTDGIHFKIQSDPVFVPETAYEKDGGVEDPRIVKIGDLYYMTYTGYNMRDAQLCLAVSKDLMRWERKGILLPAYKGKWNVGWTKSGAIIPERIQGRYWMYYLGTGPDKRDYMGLASSVDLIHWTDATDKPVLERHPGDWDSRVMEPGPPPIITPKGILLIYNGADENLVYSTGWVLFDRRDPRLVLARAEQPFFSPGLNWEREGQVPNVVFTEGLIEEKDSLLLYYGGADKYIGGMRARISFNGK